MSDDVTPNAQTEKRERHNADKIETDKRIQEVITLILSGLNTPRICQNLSTKWDAHERTIYRYVKKAREIIEAESEHSREALLLEHRAHRRDLRFRARAAGDFRAELATAQDEAKLLGLYPGDKNAMRFDDMSTEELQKHLAQMLGIAPAEKE